MKFSNKISFKFISITLILLIALQACASKTVFYTKPEPTTSNAALINRLEILGEGPNNVVLKDLNKKRKVKRFHSMSSDSVFFQLKNDKIIAYKIEEVKSYQISKRKTGVPIIGPILLTVAVISRGSASSSSDWGTALAGYYGSIILGFVSLGVSVIELTITDRNIVYFTPTIEIDQISTKATDN